MQRPLLSGQGLRSPFLQKEVAGSCPIVALYNGTGHLLVLVQSQQSRHRGLKRGPDINRCPGIFSGFLFNQIYKHKHV